MFIDRRINRSSVDSLIVRYNNWNGSDIEKLWNLNIELDNLKLYYDEFKSKALAYMSGIFGSTIAGFGLFVENQYKGVFVLSLLAMLFVGLMISEVEKIKLVSILYISLNNLKRKLWNIQIK